MKKRSTLNVLTSFAMILWLPMGFALEPKSTTDLPPPNPFLADSGRAVFHADPSQTNASSIAGPISIQLTL